MIHDFILNVLQWLYNTIACHNLFAAIVLLTVAVRVVLLPLFIKSSKDQLIMKKISPELERIKKEHKNDKERQARELMNVYREHKLNPFSGILVLIIQLPIFIVLFRIFRDSALLGELFNDGSMFLGIALTEPSIVVSALAAVAQYVNGKMTLVGGSGPGQRFSKMFVYMMPLLTILILTSLPAALGVYWTASTVFSIVQTLVIKRKLAYSDALKEGDGDGGTTSVSGAPHTAHGLRRSARLGAHRRRAPEDNARD